jgi:hypothetical protein
MMLSGCCLGKQAIIQMSTKTCLIPVSGTCEDCWLYLEVTRLISGFVGSSTSRVEGISRREEVHDEPRSLVCYQISHGGLQVT